MVWTMRPTRHAEKCLGNFDTLHLTSGLIIRGVDTKSREATWESAYIELASESTQDSDTLYTDTPTETDIPTGIYTIEACGIICCYYLIHINTTDPVDWRSVPFVIQNQASTNWETCQVIHLTKYYNSTWSKHPGVSWGCVQGDSTEWLIACGSSDRLSLIAAFAFDGLKGPSSWVVDPGPASSITNSCAGDRPCVHNHIFMRFGLDSVLPNYHHQLPPDDMEDTT